MTELHVGDIVEIVDNGWIQTHITPRWAYHYKGEIVRLNKISVTVRLDDFDGERIRVDDIDIKVLQSAVGGEKE